MMSGSLFRIETEQFVLVWSAPRQATPRVVLDCAPAIAFDVRNHSASPYIDVWTAPSSGGFPFLFEQTDYKLMVRAKGAHAIELEQRDPSLLRDMDIDDRGRLWFGVINYGGQVGLSTWRVRVDGQLAASFDVEVFPSKLSYRADYDAIMGDVQSILTGLALTYLRATTQAGATSPGASASPVEWVTLLRLLCDELEQALEFITQHPRRGVHQDVQHQQLERVKASDATALRAARLGRGGGEVKMVRGVPVRAKLPTVVSRTTLDTPEHRWIARSLNLVLDRLDLVITSERQRVPHPSTRAQAAVDELVWIARRLNRRLTRGPWHGLPARPVSYSSMGSTVSMTMQRAPGYADVYRLLRMMSHGIVVQEGPLSLNVKDLSQLYEYWCYLVFIRLLRDITGADVELTSLFSIKADGLSVLLQQGGESAISAPLNGGGRCVLTYNPTFHTHALHRQKPDMVMSFERPGWPTLHLVFDAKYRLDPRGEVGPPVDAINALHRYRDAIMVEYEGRSMHQVVQAIALFPYKEPEHERGSYEENRLWTSIERFGVGALPLLPGETSYLRRWLTSILEQHGWGLAQSAISHVAVEALYQKQMHAQDSVLVGVLGAQWSEHLTWITQNQRFFLPQRVDRPEQMRARWVALYLPEHDDAPGAVRYVAPVLDVDVVLRSVVDVPWSVRDPSALQVRYTLGPLQALSKPLFNVETTRYPKQRLDAPLWTSALAIAQGHHVAELKMTSTWAWSLYEGLRVFEPEVTVSHFQDARDQIWFAGPTWKVWRSVEEDVYQMILDDAHLHFTTLNDVLSFIGSL